MKNDKALQDQENFDIAVIGMSGCFPGARSVEELWQNLQEDKESVTFFTEEQLREAGVKPSLLATLLM